MSLWTRLNDMPEKLRATFLESDHAQRASIPEYQMKADYREMLRDFYGEVEICGHPYDSAQALEDVDPIAFNCGYADYCGSDDYLEWDGAYYLANQLEDALDAFEDHQDWLAEQEAQG